MLIKVFLHYIIHPKEVYIKLYCLWMAHKFKIKTVSFNSRVGSICGIDRITMGEKCVFGKNPILSAHREYNGYVYNPHITIGHDCNFGDWIHISAISEIKIGNGVLTGRFVIINDNAHGDISEKELDIPPILRKLTSKGQINIGNNVWLGDKVAVLGGVTIGDGCIIGANSVVTKDIPPYCVAAGCPAKVLKIMRS